MSELKNFTEELSAVHQWGIEFIKSIQTISNEPLNIFVRIFTDFATYGFVVIACVLFIWCIDYKKGLHLAYLLSFGAGVLEGIKSFLQVPRPFVHAPEIMLKAEHGFATPSGHSFNTAMMYPAVLFYDKKTNMKKAWRIGIAIALPFLVGLSRIYLGVHYPTDVLLGWFLGIIAFFIFILVSPRLDKKVSSFAESMSKISDKNIKSVKFAVAAIFSFFIIIIYPEKTYLAGALFGLGFGNIYIYEPSNLIFDARSGSLAQKITRVVLGSVLIAIPVLIYNFLGIDENHSQFRLYNFLELAVVGTIASGVAPVLFCKLNLCKYTKAVKEEKESEN